MRLACHSRQPSLCPAGRVQHYKMMFPKSGCANLTDPPDEGCVRGAEFHMSMLARFCWQADLANVDGADYVVRGLRGGPRLPC